MAENGFLVAPNLDMLLTEEENFTFLLRESNFPTAAKDGGSTSFLNGGGNLRFYTDQTKATRLPVEAYKFVTGGTPEILVYGRASVFDDLTKIFVVADNTETVQPAVDAAYGRNDTWIDWEFVTHDLITDSTGNYPNAFTINGTPTQVNGAFGNANGGYSFDGNNDWIDVDLDGRNPFSGVVDNQDVTVMTYISSGSTSTFNRAIHIHDSGTKSLQVIKNATAADRFGAVAASGSISPQSGYYEVADSSIYSNLAAVVEMQTITALPLTNIIAVNGDTGNTEKSTNGLDQGNSTAVIRFGARNDGGGDFTGTLSEARFRKDKLDPSTITLISNNLDDTANFWHTGSYDDQDLKVGVRDVIITNLAAEENRILGISVGNQIEYQYIVDGYEFIINNDGTGSAADPLTPDGSYDVPVRVWDHIDNTWGTAAVQTIVINTGNIPVPDGNIVFDITGGIVNPINTGILNNQ